jgi:hypothetical protein
MDGLQKDNLYCEIVSLLNDYANTDLEGIIAEDAACDLYNMLVKIQNCWNELTSES